MPNPQATVAAITALAIAISEGKSKRELIFISEMFSQLSHTLRTITISMIDLDGPDKPHYKGGRNEWEKK